LLRLVERVGQLRQPFAEGQHAGWQRRVGSLTNSARLASPGRWLSIGHSRVCRTSFTNSAQAGLPSVIIFE
jgi:hypothetical protein